jgi:hypothetical protein
LSCKQEAGQNYVTKIANNSFENLAGVQNFLEGKLTSQNCMHDEIGITLNFGNAYATVVAVRLT